MAFEQLTLGRYLPAASPVHRLHPAVKLVVTGGFAVSLFLVRRPAGLLAYGLLVLAAARCASVRPSLLWRGVQPVLPFVAISFVFHALFTGGERVTVGFVAVSREGLVAGLATALRLILLLAGTSLLTLTTSPVALAEGIEGLLRPLRPLGVPGHEVAMATTIALRFVPTLLDELERIRKAQMSRGADYETAPLRLRLRLLVQLLLPLLVSAFRRAEELAVAMEARGYRGAAGRTRWRPHRMLPRDWAVLAGSLTLLGGLTAAVR